MLEVLETQTGTGDKGQLYRSPAGTGNRSDLLRAMWTKFLPRSTKHRGGWLGNLPVRGVEAVFHTWDKKHIVPSEFSLEASFPRKPEDCDP